MKNRKLAILLAMVFALLLTAAVPGLAAKDKKRAVNYKHYTGQDWGDARNYHITLNSGLLGEETCVSILESLVK